MTMSIEVARQALLWCSVINYAMLLLWFVIFVFAHDTLYRLQLRWFQLSVDQFDLINYVLMAVYKLGIVLLNIVPCIALYIVA
jgi:hypothetical protein